MYKHIKNLLDSTINEDVILEIPKNSKMGHFSTPIAMMLAKKQNKNPNEIAGDIKKKLESLYEFKAINIVNGFINLELSDDFLSKSAKDAISNPNNFAKNNHNKKILLEFVSANPTGPLHIGHARGAIFGDTLARVATHLGYDIKREYYINDAGSQIDMLGNSILLAGREILGFQVEYPEEFYRGDYIVDIARDTIDSLGKQVFIDSDIDTISQFGMKATLSLIKSTLKDAKISFDYFVSEKSLINELDGVLKKLKENNAIYTKDSKVWLKSSLNGDEKDRVIIRDNNEPTYLAGDIIYHDNKFKRQYDSYINIWGADHHGYIARIKSSIDFLGYDSNKLDVILSQMVSLLKGGKPYKMSKRAGNFILMQDVIDDIGIDALRFIFVSKKADTHLEFDVDVLKNEDSNNPIYYINYANARIHTILQKSNAEISYDFSNLDSMWKELLISALLLQKVLENSFDEYAIQKLPEYLKNLASKLHFCYNASKILNNPNEGSILCILKVVSISITTGLSLMGIQAKTKM